MSLGHHPHILMVNEELDVICFRRNGQRRGDGQEPATGPFFVVREWDAKVIRAVKKRSPLMRPGGIATEQALRASVRQAILNMNLSLEPANKSEIQYLKSVNVLGKRAPSCSLLNVRDLLRLLYSFDKKRHAEELKHALRDEDRFTADDPVSFIQKMNTKPRSTPRPLTLRAAPKTPIPSTSFSIRAVEVTLPKHTATILVKKASQSGTPKPGGASFADRKRKTPNSEVAAAARAAAVAAASGLGVEGLDALLSALRKPEEETTEDGFAAAPDAKRVKTETSQQPTPPVSTAFNTAIPETLSSSPPVAISSVAGGIPLTSLQTDLSVGTPSGTIDYRGMLNISPAAPSPPVASPSDYLANTPLVWN